jgi:hypothetical protein
METIGEPDESEYEALRSVLLGTTVSSNIAMNFFYPVYSTAPNGRFVGLRWALRCSFRKPHIVTDRPTV